MGLDLDRPGAEHGNLEQRISQRFRQDHRTGSPDRFKARLARHAGHPHPLGGGHQSCRRDGEREIKRICRGDPLRKRNRTLAEQQAANRFPARRVRTAQKPTTEAVVAERLRHALPL